MKKSKNQPSKRGSNLGQYFLPIS